MKNIFIGGVAKSGKSTLSKIICKDKNYNHIPIKYTKRSRKGKPAPYVLLVKQVKGMKTIYIIERIGNFLSQLIV